MRKRAGLARALVLDPEIVLFDEPDSGLDPVRTAYLNQLIVDLNQQIGATFLIVTHDINTARTVPDNIGLLYRRHLAMFGPREMLLSSQEPVVRQFLNAQRQGPIGMAEEKDASELEAEAAAGAELPPLPPIPLQLPPTNGMRRTSQRPPGEWLLTHGVQPPPDSFAGDPVLNAPTWRGPRPKPESKPRPRPVSLSPTPSMSTSGGGRSDGEPRHRRAPAQRQPVRVRAGHAAQRVPPPVPVARADPAGVVHRERDDPADRARRDPVRRGDRVAARHADAPARRAVVHGRRRRCWR